MAQTEKPTIMDIARITGLSKGTVDRVLHNRGEVSKKSQEAVMKAIQELGYEPNVYASILARGGSHLIAVLMPNDEPGSFWDLAGDDGECYRVWIDDSDWPQTIGGENITDCFDGTLFAG